MRPDDKKENLPRRFLHQGIAGFALLAFLLSQLAWSLPASALREIQTVESGLEEEQLVGALDNPVAAEPTAFLRAGLEEVLPQPGDLEDRLSRLAGLSRAGNVRATRASLAGLAYAKDGIHPPISREELVERLLGRRPLIATQPLGLTRVRTPWEKIDLTRLNDLGRYSGEHAVAEVARDAELAHWLGLLQIRNMRRGLSPGTLYAMLKDHLPAGAEKVAVGWIVWSNLILDAEALHQTGAWTSDDGQTTLTYRAAADGSPIFTVNGELVSDPADAEAAFLLAHPDAIHFGSAFTALPSDLKQTRTSEGAFRWPVLEGSRQDWLSKAAAGLEEEVDTRIEKLTNAVPEVGLRELFLALGVPQAVLDAVRAEELEKVLARERAA